jgi:outer membrane protein assembly factor BamA
MSVMWRILLAGLTLVWTGAAGDKTQSPELNVNSRYTIESSQVTGRLSHNVSKPLRRDIERIVGTKLDQNIVNGLRDRLAQEFRNAAVNVRVARGTKAEHVTVSFEVSRREKSDFDVNVPKALYHARQGWSGGVEGEFRWNDNVFRLGTISDGDALMERFAGVNAGYERDRIGTDAIGARFRVESYRAQWNSATLNQFSLPSGTAPAYPGLPAIYRTRQTFAPEIVFRPKKDIEISAGVRVANFETQYPVARTESANAITTGVRLRHTWEGTGDTDQELSGGYSLISSISGLGADYRYTRHAVDARYEMKHKDHTLMLAFLAGSVSGDAPMFDRFVLGNFSTLRGWNKYDLAPVGGSRVAHGSVEYRYDNFEVFYDTGTIWDPQRNPGQKHSVGGGLHYRGFHIAVAFPLKSGKTDPIFMLGTAF